MVRSLFGCLFFFSVLSGTLVTNTVFAAEGPVVHTRQLLGFGDQVPHHDLVAAGSIQAPLKKS